MDTGVAIFGLYALVFVGLSIFLKYRRRRHHLLHVHRSLSLGLVSLAFFASNCSALEVVTMIALSARYGMLAVHFYWIGAIPALCFLLLVLLPRYKPLRLTTVPEYLGQRYETSTQVLSAFSFTCLMVAMSGIALGLTGRILHLIFGIDAETGVWAVALLTALFLMSDGVRGVIYAEVLQLVIFLIVMAPLAVMTLRHGGSLPVHLQPLPEWQRHTLGGLALVAPHDRLDLAGTLLGLGLCLGFSYWCGDFLLIQRLCAAREEEMLQTPKFTMLAKLVLPVLLVLPGLGLARVPGLLTPQSSDLALPLLLRQRYMPVLATFAVCTLCASFFMGVCSNLIAAAGVYARSVAPLVQPLRALPDRFLLLVLCVAAGVAGVFSLHSRGLMESIQIAFSMLNLPVACVLLGGVFIHRLPRQAGTPAILAGAGMGLVHWRLSPALYYGSPLSQSFYGAIVSAGASAATLLAIGVLRPGEPATAIGPLTGSYQARTVAIAAAAMLGMVALYVAFA